MAYDPELANRLREALQSEAGLTEKPMFGGLGFMIDGNLAVSASGQGGLLLRVDPAQADWVAHGVSAARSLPPKKPAGVTVRRRRPARAR